MLTTVAGANQLIVAGMRWLLRSWDLVDHVQALSIRHAV